MSIDTASFIAFLRMEADLSDEKAKRLRLQADELAEQHGITIDMESSFELNPSELAPLDAFGNPKYKGRKRGRKPKKRKRALNPNRQKRQHTAYTLFVHEVYPTIRAQYQDTENYQSKDIIGLVARQWATISEEEKRLWKERALASHQDAVDVEEEDGDNEDDEEEDEDDDELQQEEEVEVEVPKPKRGRSKKKV